MNARFTRLVALALGLALLPSCTARYQQMLLNKDMEIRDLQARIAELTATNAELESREKGWRTKVSALEQRAKDASAERTDEPAEVARVQKDLQGVADVRYRNGRLSIGIDNVVTFSSGSTKLKQSAGSTLRRVARVLNRDYATRRIYVEGHTDTDPIRRTKKRFRSNRHLSAERADSVAAFLTQKCGVAESNVVVVGYGPHDPITRGAGRGAKARNRRVEIVVGEDLSL